MNDLLFHVSLHAADLDRSVTFYRHLLGVDPVRHRKEYAKFELEDPPLVLSLLTGAAGRGGSLDHLGLRVPDAETLVAIQFRLEAAGIPSIREDGVSCCHSRQTKFWARDPDGVLWEIYLIDDEGGDEETASYAESLALANDAAAPSSRIWSHAIGDPLEPALGEPDHTFDVVELEGTINDGACDPAALFSELLRVLKPGREIRLHGLTADRAIEGPLPPLPGPAFIVTRVPAHSEVLAWLGTAGFVGVRLTRLSSTAHFEIGGVALREFRAIAVKPGFRGGAKTHSAIYLGPLAEVRDDLGNVFRRGEVVSLNAHDRQRLESDQGGRFLLLP
jgi:catechol 2,3-dioxygenase-like lactoylglutathione lyase family enzyme